MCFTSNFSQTYKAENVVTLHFWYPTRKNAECFCKFTPKMSPADITLCVGLQPNKFLSAPVDESYLRHRLRLGIRCRGCDRGGQLNLSRAPRRVASSERERKPIQHESDWERQSCRQGTLGQDLQVCGCYWSWSFGQVRLYRHFFIEFNSIEFYLYSAKLQQQSPQIFKHTTN